MALSDFLKGKIKKDGGAATTLTSINIRLGGDIHSLPGRDVDKTFIVNIPFKNKMGSGLLPDNLKGPDVTINSITIDRPFELLEVSPELPCNVPFMSEEKFTLRIKAPEGSYNGPLLVRFDTGNKDSIDIKMSRIILTHGTKSVELESGATSMNVKKGQVFRRDIQLYKILSFDQKINSIEVSKPFGFVLSEPNVPLVVDKKDSYVMNIFIKCPDFSYAGELEIKFK